MKTFTSSMPYSEKLRLLTIAVFLFASCSFRAQTLLIPFTGSLSVPCGSNVPVQDHAGNSNYSNNADGYVVFDAGAAAAINIAGTYTTENSWDFVRIYNGVGTGGALLQTFTGAGNINFQGAPGQTLTVRFQSDGSVVMAGFNLNVTYSGACSTVACSSAPSSNTVVGPSVLICPNAGPNTLTLSVPYITGSSPATAVAMTGLTYAWYTGTVSSVGPFPTLVPTATNNIYSAPGTTVTTWYQAVITCTNGGPYTTSATAGAVNIAGTTTSVVPYYEGFEGIGFNDKLPNCSWYTASLGTVVRTYTTSGTNNRVPRNGTSFAAFQAPSNSVTVWSNGIQMEPGITYSAAIHYATEYLSNNNWSGLQLFVSPNQNNTGMVQLAQATPAISGPYSLLSNIFTVPSSGIYYLAINANGIGGAAPYLMIDDISVTIPCDLNSGNSPTVSATAVNTVICLNDVVSLTAFGADTYNWTTGDTGPVTTPTALAIGINTIFVTGTNTLTGCSSTSSIVLNVLPNPALNIYASSPTVCVGQAVNLSASSNGQVVWSNSTSGLFTSVAPLVNTTYFANSTGANGCTSTASIQILAIPLPTVMIAPGPAEMCAGELLSLTGSGAVSFQWNWNVNVSMGLTLNDNPLFTTTYTLTGTAANGCSNKTNYTQNVNTCQGVNELKNAANVLVYPNPFGNSLTVEKAGSFDINITDIAGRLVFQQSALFDNADLNLDNLAAGVYYLNINGSDDSNKTIKIVKQ